MTEGPLGCSLATRQNSQPLRDTPPIRGLWGCPGVGNYMDLSLASAFSLSNPMLWMKGNEKLTRGTAALGDLLSYKCVTSHKVQKLGWQWVGGTDPCLLTTTTMCLLFIPSFSYFWCGLSLSLCPCLCTCACMHVYIWVCTRVCRSLHVCGAGD